MNSNKFKILFENASASLSDDRFNCLIDESIYAESWYDTDSTLTHLHFICMEELSELIQAISKQMRTGDYMHGLIEEMADVYIVLKYLMRMYDISEASIKRAINVKLDRLERKLDSEGYYE